MAAAEASATAKPPKTARRVLITPEGVDLGLRIGEASERAAAFLLDAVFIGGGLVALTLLCVFAMVATKVNGGEIILVIWLLGAFAARNLYFIAFEMGPRAATPGKRLVGLRVASRDGGRLTSEAVIVRNAMRELEVFLPLSYLGARAFGIDGWIVALTLVWCGVFVFFPLFNRDRLRAGDLVAGTWVVKAPRHRLLPDMAVRGGQVAARFAFTAEQLDAYGVKELHVLEEVLRRSNVATVRDVAQRIRRKIGWSAAPAESDWAFLDAYYTALRGRLEGRLLMGKRRADKFDKP